MGANSPHETARAKINLTLHVGPVRADGYHPLQSLVVFADIGDALSVEIFKADRAPSMEINGPFAAGLRPNQDNLVLQAAKRFGLTPDKSPHFSLTKNLPIASGIGGGSADAAAAIRLLAASENRDISDYLRMAADLGSDVPVCLLSQTSIMSGRGEELTAVPGKGRVHAVLVNPGVSVSTREIFALFDETDLASPELDHPDTKPSLLEIARAGRNDLQNVAISLCPDIVHVLAEIEHQPGCRLARMSGSGATCFGLFGGQTSARQAVLAIAEKNPDWWSVPVVLGDEA